VLARAARARATEIGGEFLLFPELVNAFGEALGAVGFDEQAAARALDDLRERAATREHGRHS
jgi:hypothetical protein